jgi:hypothetical protein
MATITAPKAVDVKPLVARDILAATHPLNGVFTQWVAIRNTPPTKRQAALFLAAHPNYRVARVAG